MPPPDEVIPVRERTRRPAEETSPGRPGHRRSGLLQPRTRTSTDRTTIQALTSPASSRQDFASTTAAPRKTPAHRGVPGGRPRRPATPCRALPHRAALCRTAPCRAVPPGSGPRPAENIRHPREDRPDTGAGNPHKVPPQPPAWARTPAPSPPRQPSPRHHTPARHPGNDPLLPRADAGTGTGRTRPPGQGTRTADLGPATGIPDGPAPGTRHPAPGTRHPAPGTHTTLP